MESINPHKRKSLHEKESFTEIIDNVKNDAMLTKLESKTINNDSNVLTSDEEDSDDLESNESLNNIDTTDRNTNTIRNRHFNTNTDVSNESLLNYSSKNRLHKEKPQAPKNITISKIYTFLGLILLIGGFILIYKNVISTMDNIENNINTKDEQTKFLLNNVRETLKSIMTQYKNQETNLWTDVYLSISNLILDPTKPSIILLLGNTSDPLDCLAVLFGNVTSNALNSGRLLLTPEKFDKDLGTVIQSLRSNIKDNKAVIVRDLLNINAEALKAFHNLCDRINPLVEEVLIIITVVSNDFDRTNNPLQFIENQLFKKLSGKIKNDAIQPLITRITDGTIITVNPEPSITRCPLPKN